MPLMPETPVVDSERVSWLMTGTVVVALSVFLSLFVIVGADCYWLVALGDDIAEHGRVPVGIPFAAARSDDWPNVLVLAQLILAGIHSLGGAALPITQIVVDAAALLLLALGARRAGASDRATAVVLVLVAFGSLASLAIVRLQVLSLVPFAVLLLLLREDERSPGRRIWLVPALVALWTNLHGAVLLGVAVTGAYLLFSRLRVRPAETVAVGVATVLALLVTPVGLRTVDYYLGVMENEAAVRGTGLWARPTLSNPFDVLMIVAGALLLVLALRRRQRVWEYVVLLGLAVGTLTAARHGVWLLMAATTPAALTLTRRRRAVGADRDASLRGPVVALLASAVVAAAVVLPRGDDVLPAEPDLVDAVADRVGDRVVLAPEPLAESLAVAGVTVWAADPIDAFDHDVQRAFLDFLDGGPDATRAVAASDAVVVEEGSEAEELMASQDGFDSEPLVDGWVLHVRRESS